MSMWTELLQSVTQFKNAKNVLIQFDFSMYGSMLVSATLLPFLAVLKSLGYKTHVVSHHVVMDVGKLSGHMGLTNSFRDSIKTRAFNVAFHSFYRALGLVSNSVIVLEDILKERLSKYIPAKKIIAIPHAVDTNLEKISKAEARKKLGIAASEKVVLFFGFVNWFKGADIFAKNFAKTQKLLGKKARFIIAGGESITLSSKEYYKEFYNGVVNTTQNSSSVDITGYVPQEKIVEYFSAADLIVFPYREFMCASGVLSLAFSYKKPFIVSDKLEPMLTAPDFSEAMKDFGLTTSDLSFELSKESMLKQTTKVLRNGLKRKMSLMGAQIRKQRSFQNTAKTYERAIFAPSSKLHKSPRVRYAYGA